MDEDMDLFYHALNYRGASSEHAEFFWKELRACVDRLIASKQEDCANLCERLWNEDGKDGLDCAYAIRMSSNV